MVDRLPEEAITHILSFLSVSDRKEGSLVNHSWYNASLHPVLLKDTVVKFQPNMSTLQIVKSLVRRRTPNLVLDQIDSSFNSTETIEETTKPLALILQSLTLKGSNITESAFMALIQNCSSLSSLDLSSCNSLFLSGQLLSKQEDIEKLKITLQHVKNLSLASIRHLSDQMLNRFLDICPSIESLNLSGNQIRFNSMYAMGTTASMSLLTIGNLENFLKSKSHQMKCLNLSRTAVSTDSITSLASIPGLQLTEMILVCCRDLCDEGIFALAKLQSGMQNLDLSQSTEIGDTALQAICQNMLNLKVLKLSKCRQITDASVRRLYLLPALQYLDLSSCYTLTSSGLIAGLCGNPMTSLTHLNLHGCVAVRDSFVVKLAKALPQLQHLDLSSCEITDVSVYFICKYLYKLQVLHLAWCKEITDAGLLGLPLLVGDNHYLHKEMHGDCKCIRREFGKNVLNLPKIDEKRAQQTNWIELKQLLAEEDDGVYKITDLKGLRVLDVTACYRLTDDSITALQFPELRKLCLGLCLNLSDVSVLMIAANLPSLEELYLSQCNKITNAGLEAASRMQRLAVLDISNCDHVNDVGLSGLIGNATHLRQLDVSMCNGVTYQMVEEMERKMPHLHTVQKRLVNGMVI